MSDETSTPPEQRIPAWIGNAEHFRWLDGLLRVAVVLNISDALFTLWWVLTGRAREANPLLAHLIDYSPVLFIVVKTGLCSLGLVLLWRLRRRPLAVVGLMIVFLAYYFLLWIHLGALGAELGTFLRRLR